MPPTRSLLFAALRSTLSGGYTLTDLRADVGAAATTAFIALPLSAGLAIATGLPPQYGLYTAVVAGAVAALAGGARFSVTGPTAAFVVVLGPIVAVHGLGGLLLATAMAGVALLLVLIGAAIFADAHRRWLQADLA